MAKKVAVVSKAKGAVPGGCRVSSTARRRLYFPANSTHNKRPFYPHNNLTAFLNSKTGPTLWPSPPPGADGRGTSSPGPRSLSISPGGRPGALSGAIFLRCGTVCYQGVWADWLTGREEHSTQWEGVQGRSAYDCHHRVIHIWLKLNNLPNQGNSLARHFFQRYVTAWAILRVLDTPSWDGQSEVKGGRGC